MNKLEVALNGIDALEKEAAACEASVFSFIDGVEDFCKESNLSTEQSAHVWGALGTSLEKHAVSGFPYPTDNVGATPAPAPTPAPAQPLHEQGIGVGAGAGVRPMDTKTKPFNVAKSHFNKWIGDWQRDPSGMLGAALPGAAIAGLGSLLYTGMRGRDKDEERKPWLRNALLAALVGGGAYSMGGNALGNLGDRLGQGGAA